MKHLKTFDQVNEKLQYSNVAMLWGKMYGEDFDEEYPAITRDLKTKYRKGFTKDELADLWSKRYGEDMPIEYEGFWRNLKEAKGWGGKDVVKWKPEHEGGYKYLQIMMGKEGYQADHFYHKEKGAYVGDYILEIPAKNSAEEKKIIKLLKKHDKGGKVLEESLQTVEEAMTAMERKYINESNFNLEDLEYQIPLSIENTGLNPRMFKAVKKEGKNYRVVLSSYASEMQMQQILGDTNLTLDSSLKILDGPKKGQNAIFIIGEAVDNFKVNERKESLYTQLSPADMTKNNKFEFPKSFDIKDKVKWNGKKFFKGTYNLQSDNGKKATYFNRGWKAELTLTKDDLIDYDFKKIGRFPGYWFVEVRESVNERKKYTETEFTKPGQDGDVYFSKREGNAIAVRQGDKLHMLSDFQGKASLAKIIGSDKRWENMGKPSEKLLVDLALKNVGGLNTRERSTERGKLLYKFITAGLKESMGHKIKNPVRHKKVAYKEGDMEKLLSGKLKLDDKDKNND